MSDVRSEGKEEGTCMCWENVHVIGKGGVRKSVVGSRKVYKKEGKFCK